MELGDMTMGARCARAVRRLTIGLAAAVLLSASLASGIAAETAAVGNGGDSLATASGGAVSVGSAETGDSTGNVIAVGTSLLGDEIAAAVAAAFGGGEEAEATEETAETEETADVVVE